MIATERISAVPTIRTKSKRNPVNQFFLAFDANLRQEAKTPARRGLEAPEFDMCLV